MSFPNYFADADSDFNESKYIIFGVPYDKTSSFRPGASQAPREIRRASWNFETYHLRTHTELKHIKFHDYGDLDVKNDKPKNMIKKIKGFTTSLLQKNKFPIAIGGEHSITPGIIQAFDKNIGVLSLDAHLDFRNIYEDEPYSHACVIKRIADHLDIENIAVLGIRSTGKEEFDDAKKNNLFFIDSFTIHEKGIEKAIYETKKYLKNNHVYLTMDIDVVDPAHAPGAGTPEPFGLTPLQILEVIESFSGNLVGFDITEVCPPYDMGQTSILAAKLVRIVIDETWKNRNPLT